MMKAAAGRRNSQLYLLLGLLFCKYPFVSKQNCSASGKEPCTEARPKRNFNKLYVCCGDSGKKEAFSHVDRFLQ